MWPAVRGCSQFRVNTEREKDRAGLGGTVEAQNEKPMNADRERLVMGYLMVITVRLFYSTNRTCETVAKTVKQHLRRKSVF